MPYVKPDCFDKTQVESERNSKKYSPFPKYEIIAQGMFIFFKFYLAINKLITDKTQNI